MLKRYRIATGYDTSIV